MAEKIDTSAGAIAARYLIRKQGAWYRPNSSGYTDSAIQAGRYTLDEAMEITHTNGADGPRDGMTFAHENEVVDADLAAYRALAAERDALAARVAEVEACLDAAERDHRISDNGNLWRFWADQAKEFAALATAAEAENAELRRKLGGGCDASNGGSHHVIKQGSYSFCAKCGESLKAAKDTK